MSLPQDRILVVDDDENILFLLTRALERGGYSVVSTPDSLQALELIKSGEKFSVLLTDLLMPNLSGMDLLRMARDLDAELEIVVITAAGSIESAIHALRDGQAWDYLLKPLESFQQVTAVIDRAVAHRRLALDRAALQSQVEAEAERLRALVASVGEAIIAASSQGMITVTNPAAQRMLGIPERTGSQADEALPPRLMRIIANWQVVGSQFPATLEINWAPGLSLLVSLNPMPEPGGGQGWVMALRDITALKQQDKLKTQAMAEVVSKIRLLLAQAMNSLVELNLRLQQDERTASSLFRLTRVWENIQTWGDELLAVAQADASRAPYPTPVDLQQMLGKLPAEPSVLRFQQGGGRLTVTVDAELQPILTDAELLAATLHSLVRRAILRTQTNKEIRVHAREHERQVWVEISDSGPPAEDTSPVLLVDQSMNRLTGDPARTPAHAGMELMRARSMVERLEGQLWIGGRGARGSTIILCLPPSLTLSGPKM
jgi:FixJ family two-component response regulator